MTLSLCLLLGAVAPAGAQPATPAATPPAVAAGCDVPRREIPAIAALINAPPPATPLAAGLVPGDNASHDHGDEPGDASAIGGDATAEASPAPAEPVEPAGTPRLLRPELPDAPPAGPAATAAVGETMTRYLACANASDVIGLMSLVSDEFLRYTFGAGRLSEADLRAYAAASRPLPEADQRRLVAVREARLLADGRVVALVDHAPVASTNPNAVATDLVTFVPVDQRYLIDRYLAGVTIWFGPNVTPGP
jgi:hypothetical protein